MGEAELIKGIISIILSGNVRKGGGGVFYIGIEGTKEMKNLLGTNYDSLDREVGHVVANNRDIFSIYGIKDLNGAYLKYNNMPVYFLE